MSGWVSSWLRGGDGDEETKGEARDETAAVPAVVPSADEIRRKRLERLQQMEQQQQQQKQQEEKPSTADVAMEDVADAAVPAESAPVKPPPVEAKPTPTPTPAPLPVQKKKAPSGGTTPRSYVNDMLQRVLQLTLSRAVAAVNGKYYYLADVATSLEDGDHLLNASRLGEVLYARIILSPSVLTGTAQPVATLQYLAECFYRCRDEQQALQSSYLRLSETDKKGAEQCLTSLREMCINYSVTALTEPDMFPFAVGSLNTDALEKIVRTQANPLTGEFIDAIVAELDQQEGGAVYSVFAPLFQKLLSELFLINPPSLMSNFFETIHLLTLLVRNKLLAGVFTSIPGFFLLPGPEATGRRLQDATALGLLLRFSTSQDPAVQQLFANITKRTKTDVDNTVVALRGKLSTVQNGVTEIVKVLLKAGGSTRENVMVWLELAMALNVERAKENPDVVKTSTAGTMLNLSMVLLRLCGPFMPPESKKANLINSAFLTVRSNVFPSDVTRLLGNRAGQTEDDRRVGAASDFNFITRCYFTTARSIHLGPVGMIGQYMSLLRNISYYQPRINDNTDPRVRAHFESSVATKFTMDAELLHPDLLHEMLRFALLSCSVINGLCSSGGDAITLPLPAPASLAQDHALRFLPEHILDDVCTIFKFVARLEPKALTSFPLDELLRTILIFLTSPSYVRSPHLRAKMSELLFFIFLPAEEVEERHTAGTSFGVHLLTHDPLAQTHLAPSLLALYGDVEQTGFYEKLEHRYNIACLLKYLWKIPGHKQAFVKISEDRVTFVKFAHGLMNHINGLVTDALISLPEIKTLQEEMQDVARWMALDETIREQKQSLLAEKERTVTSSLQLANETIHMMSYLTSEIQAPFVELPELEDRLVSMLNSVLVKLAGPRGLELKVNNSEQYKFRPKEMLREIVETLLHFAHYESFQKAVAANGYYEGPVFRKCVSIVRRTQLVPADDMDSFEAFVNKVEIVSQDLVNWEEALGDIPEEFLDPLMVTLMKDPVTLPTSGKVMERATITQHLMNDPSDPFTRAPLAIEDLVANTELKTKIEQWVQAQQQK
jgi:ubiquitin conjugation factor E4 B